MIYCVSSFLVIIVVVALETTVKGEIVSVTSKEQKLGLFEAEIACVLFMQNEPYTESGLYCHRVWDTLACWPDTPAGATSTQPCANYVNGFDTSICSLGLVDCGDLHRFLKFELLTIWPDNDFKRLQDVTPEDCAAQCIMGSFPDCASFRYKEEHQKCDLLAKVPDDTVNVLSPSIHGWDYYLLQKDLDRFTKFKSLSLWPDNEFKRLEAVTPEDCAAQCIMGSYPGCTSFRYKEEHQKCDLLAKHLDDKVNVLSQSVHGWDFYLLQTDLDRFTKFKSLNIWPDNEFKRLQDVTPEDCAEQCIMGSYPGCVSFRYKEEHQKCDLLTKIPDDDVNVLKPSIHGWDFYLLQTDSADRANIKWNVNKKSSCLWTRPAINPK